MSLIKFTKQGAQDAGTKGVVFPLNGKFYFCKADEYGQAEFSKMTGPYDSVDFAKRDAKSAYGVTITEVMTRTPRGGEYHKVKDACDSSCGQDGADDGIAAVERGIRGLLEDAKKAKSVYDDILKRSAIANKNEAVRQNFVSYIARCDKVIRALESIR